MSRSRWATGGAAVALMVSVLGLLLLAGKLQHGPDGRESAPAGERKADRTYRMMQRRFDAITGKQQAAPLGVIRLLEKGNGVPEALVETASFQKVGRDSGNAWIMISGNIICIVEMERDGAACDRVRAVYKRGLAVGTFEVGRGADEEPERFLLAGIAPDGKIAVDLSIGATHQRRPVHHNYYSATAEVPINVLGLIDG